MSRSALKKVAVVLVALVGAVVVSACSCLSNPPVRSYYLDDTCRYYYVDGAGRTIYGDKYIDARFIGLTLKEECDGRWFYTDHLGNKVYVSKMCGMHFKHRIYKEGSCMMHHHYRHHHVRHHHVRHHHKMMDETMPKADVKADVKAKK